MASSSSAATSGSSSAISASASRSSASACSGVKLSSGRWVRVCSAPTLAAASGSSQKPAAPIWASSSASRSLSPAGSKIVREQGQLLTDGGQALRGGLLGCSGHVRPLRLAGTRCHMGTPVLDRLDPALGDVLDRAMARHHLRGLRANGHLRALAPGPEGLGAERGAPPREGNRLEVLID